MQVFPATETLGIFRADPARPTAGTAQCSPSRQAEPLSCSKDSAASALPLPSPINTPKDGAERHWDKLSSAASAEQTVLMKVTSIFWLESNFLGSETRLLSGLDGKSRVLLPLQRWSGVFSGAVWSNEGSALGSGEEGQECEPTALPQPGETLSCSPAVLPFQQVSMGKGKECSHTTTLGGQRATSPKGSELSGLSPAQFLMFLVCWGLCNSCV